MEDKNKCVEIENMNAEGSVSDGSDEEERKQAVRAWLAKYIRSVQANAQKQPGGADRGSGK